MKIYFDNLDSSTGNQVNLTTNGDSTHWIVSGGTVVKQKLRALGKSIDLLSNIDEPGCYIIDVNGDPNWWSGVLKENDVPKTHILNLLPTNIIDLVKKKMLRLIIAADKEGGGMITPTGADCFQATTDAMIQQQLPVGSVLIIQGNKQIAQQYELWLNSTGAVRMFEVQWSCHFDRIFFDENLPEYPLVLKSIEDARYDYNSLNRVYRSHRGAHCYYLATNDLLKSGLVSCNAIEQIDEIAAAWNSIPHDVFNKTMNVHFPIHIDGNWANTNAANQYNLQIYENSLISFITETKFDEHVVFLTEKIFKPLALGHPIILLASSGTLRGLQDLGFKIDWCGIDPSYNDIVDDKKRFIKTNEILKWWINLSKTEQRFRIESSMDTIQHNFNLVRNSNFYHQSLLAALANSEEYFND